MDVNSRAAAAAKDEKLKNEFIGEYKNFILSSASKTLKHSVTDSDDEFMTAMIAFNEAIDAFDTSKGGFLSFASVIIRRRLIDQLRRSSSYANEMFFSSLEEEDGTPFDVPVYTDYSMRWEIEALTDELAGFGITFPELADVSPKSRKTKRVCLDAVRFVLGDGDMLETVMSKHKLPIKELTEIAGINRKTLDRHRKYIIAAVVITSGDYPGIAGYLNVKGV